MKSFYTLLLLSALATAASAQTTAMDWTRTDCDGNSHNLFTELDNGKVILLEFVMDCPSCYTAAKSIKKLYAEFQESHPGKVETYTIGYYNAMTCEDMNAWKAKAECTWQMFTGGKTEAEYYGGFGMPTIVVLGGADHKVLYKKIGFSSSEEAKIRTAISAALAQSSVEIKASKSGEFIIMPNPSSYAINVVVSGLTRPSTYKIIDVSGITVLEGQYRDSRDGNLQVRSGRSDDINVSSLPSGSYTIILSFADSKVLSSQFTVTR
jgi:thiol-disulfide isomerase/thioredoxin